MIKERALLILVGIVAALLSWAFLVYSQESVYVWILAILLSPILGDWVIRVIEYSKTLRK